MSIIPKWRIEALPIAGGPPESGEGFVEVIVEPWVSQARWSDRLTGNPSTDVPVTPLETPPVAPSLHLVESGVFLLLSLLDKRPLGPEAPPEVPT